MDLTDWLRSGLVRFYCLLLHCRAGCYWGWGEGGEIRAGYYYCILEWHPIEWLLFNIINLSPSIIHNLLLASSPASHLEILNCLHSGLTNVFCCNNVTKIPLIGHHKSSKYSNCRLWSFFKIVQIKYCVSWELHRFRDKKCGHWDMERFLCFLCFLFLCWWHSLWRSEITVGNIGELGGGTTKRGDKAGLNIGWQFVFWAVWICSIHQPSNHSIQFNRSRAHTSSSANVK